LGGSFFHVFGIMMASLGTKYYQILLAGVCSAVGASAIFQPCKYLQTSLQTTFHTQRLTYTAVTCVGGWFNRKRGAAFGILFTGSSIGGVVFPIMISHLIRDIGFGWAMRTSAFLILFLLLIANMTVRAYHAPQRQTITNAQMAKPLADIQFLLLTAGFFCFSYGFFVPINYLPLQAISAGMDPSLAQYLLPILNAGSLFGRLFSGFLGDKIGRYNIFIVVCYLSGIWILALWLPATSDAALVAFAVLFGFFSGAYISLIMPLVMAISPLAELGCRTGIIMLVTAIGGLTTNPINGAILDSADGAAGLKIFSGILCLAGTTFVLVARVRKTGRKLFARF
jgi:MFS family permease